MSGHPLADEERTLFDRCNHVFSEPGLGATTMKTSPLSDELKARLVRLGEVYGLAVTFPTDAKQQYVFAVRAKKNP